MATSDAALMLVIIIISYLHLVRSQSEFEAATAAEEIQFLNELPLDKLLKLKTSIEDLATPNYQYENITDATPSFLETFGAQAMALKAPKRKSDYEEVWHKGESSSKISNIFSMSVTTLAFLAFGGYLLCLIVQAVKAKHMYLPATTPVTPTFFVSNIKKRPQVLAHAPVSSYGRRKRSAPASAARPRLQHEDVVAQQLSAPAPAARPRLQHEDVVAQQLRQLDLPPDQLFDALIHVCEGYAKWSRNAPL